MCDPLARGVTVDDSSPGSHVAKFVGGMMIEVGGFTRDAAILFPTTSLSLDRLYLVSLDLFVYQLGEEIADNPLSKIY